MSSARAEHSFDPAWADLINGNIASRVLLCQNATVRGLWAKVAFQRGRWIGRKDAIVVGSRGIAPSEVRTIFGDRARELHGSKRDGFWYGVLEMRPEDGLDREL